MSRDTRQIAPGDGPKVTGLADAPTMGTIGMSIRRLPVAGAATIAEVELLHTLGALGRLPADQEQWAFGPLCLLLTDRVALAAPVPCRGMLGFWTLTAAVEIAVRDQGGGGR